MSHQNVKGSPAAVGSLAETPLSGRTTPSMSSTSQNMSSWTVSRSVSCNNREPIFNASSHVLQLQVAGRSVTVPVPVSVESIEPTAEQPPPDCLPPRIEWAYGYRGKDVRNNVHYLPTGELVYFCGSVVVLYNINEQYQRHYTDHTSDVKCRVLIASGQTTCHRRDRRPEFDRRDVIVTPLDIEEELEHNHTEAYAVHPGGVFALCVSRKGTLLSAGKDRTVAEWETTDLVRRRRPVEGDSEDVTYCVAVPPHLFITASADGGVRQYDTSTKKRNWRKNYAEGITCMSVDPPGALLALGFTDGSWSILDLSTKENVFEQKESTQPITTIQFSPSGSMLFVGTKVLFLLALLPFLF
ncbi:HELP domain protein [Ostertagia ostertagi]